MPDRPLQHLRDLHQKHVVAVMRTAVHEDRALENPDMQGDETHKKLMARRNKAHAAFYRAVDELEAQQ